jgi:hypothetical protein
VTATFKSTRSDSINSIPVRCAYLHLHDKKTKRSNGQPVKTPHYAIGALLFPKTHADPMQCANYKWLAQLCMDAAVKAWGNFPAGGHWPIQDGDQVKAPVAPALPGQAPVAVKEYPWRKGHWIVETTNYLDPGPRVAAMQGAQAVEVPARVINGKAMYKSGDVFIVNMHAYTFQNEKFGCNFGFEGALWMAEGEAIGSSGPRTAAQMFGSIAPVASASVAPPAAQPAMPVAPLAHGSFMMPGAPPMPPGMPTSGGYVAPTTASMPQMPPQPGAALPPFPGAR